VTPDPIRGYPGSDATFSRSALGTVEPLSESCTVGLSNANVMPHRSSLSLALIVAAACGGEALGPIDGLPRELSVNERQLVQANNTFAWKIFHALHEADPETNLFISPVSISMALGMTYNGANGVTLDEMGQVLEFYGMSNAAINQAYRDLIDLLFSLDSRVDFDLANSIWAREGVSFEQAFLEVNRQYFDAQVSVLDFTNPTAARTINDWVSDETRGKIKSIVPDPIPSNVVMYLIDAIYFKGTWTHQFDKSLTQDRLFTLEDGSVVSIPTMSHETPADLRSTSNSLATIIDLAYGGGAFSMSIVLPRENATTGDVIRAIDGVTWEEWTASVTEGEAVVKMPKFRLEYEAELRGPLMQLGMVSAFGNGADLSRMSAASDFFISNVKHKSFVDVNEEGTEAAAATAVSIADCACGPAEFTVDRPFVFVIRERFSGTVLFMGTVMDPRS